MRYRILFLRLMYTLGIAVVFFTLRYLIINEFSFSPFLVIISVITSVALAHWGLIKKKHKSKNV
ncbi:hypothetical protein FHS86_000928 [Roseimarinus sediminis]|jgi:hypothetical protein